MKKNATLFCLLFLAQVVISQNITLSGRLIDTLSAKPLIYASVSLQQNPLAQDVNSNISNI